MLQLCNYKIKLIYMDAVNAVIKRNTKPNFYKIIVPIISSVFSVYLTIGVMLGTLPQYIQGHLKYSSIIVGIVIGLESIATLLTRAYAGKLTDTKGAKRSSRIGSFMIVSSGVFYLMASLFSGNVIIALAFILLAVLVQGTGESLFVTGSLTWGIGLAGVDQSGKVMTWNGIAMYAGIALGAPLGIALTNIAGIETAFIAIILLAVISLMATYKLPVLAVDLEHVRTPFYKVIGKISSQGLGLAFSSIGFACISSFVALFFAQKQWGDASLAFMLFGGSYVLVRIFFSSYPDKYGAYTVAMVSFIVEVIGQFCIGFAPSKFIAIMGCCLTGAGFSLIFPALGVLAIKKVSPQMRGTALGAYGAFFDFSLGIAAPLAGLVAKWFSYQAVYLFGALAAVMAIVVLLLGKQGKTQ